MAFCPNCGTNNYDGVYSCVRCGTVLGGGYYPPQKKKSNTGLVVGIAAIVIAVVAIVAFLFVSGNSPEAPIKNFIKAMNTGEVKYLEKVFPEAIYDKYSDELDELEEGLEMEKEDAEDEYGSGKFEYKVIRKTKLDSNKLDEAEEYLEYIYEAEGLDSPKVTAGFEMRVKLSYNGSKEKNSHISTVSVYKIDGQWCLLGFF